MFAAMSIDEKILKAVVRVFAQHGFRGSTTRSIAQEAEVNEVTLFRRFGTKAALIEAAIRHHAETSVAVSLPSEPVDPEHELTSWCTQQIAHLRESRALLRKFMCEVHLHPELMRAMKEAPMFKPTPLFNYIIRLQQSGMASDDFDVAAAVQMLRGTIFSDAMGRDMNPSGFPEEEKAAALYTQLFLRAIGVVARSKPPGRSASQQSRSRSRARR
jgi:AcrR family transcriptional regulator